MPDIPSIRFAILGIGFWSYYQPAEKNQVGYFDTVGDSGKENFLKSSNLDRKLNPLSAGINSHLNGNPHRITLDWS